MTRVSAANRTLFVSRAGFSLIELLVGVAVASILMLVLIKFVQSATEVISTNDDILFSTNDAQAALDLISQDLRSVRAIPPILNTTGAAAATAPQVLQAYQETTGVKDTAAKNGTIYPMQLMLLANSGGSTQSGSTTPTPDTGTHLIRYSVQYQDPVVAGGTNPTYGLYRDFLTSDETFGKSGDSYSNTGGIGGLADLYTSYWNSNSFWKGGTPSPTSNFLVNNVVDFQVLFYDSGSATPLAALNYPSGGTLPNSFVTLTSSSFEGETVSYSASGLIVNGSATSTSFSHLIAEVKLTLLNQTGANLLANSNLTFSSTPIAGKGANATRVYMRRVPLQF